MIRSSICLLFALTLVGPSALMAQSDRIAACPDANPVQRPGFATTSQSRWDIAKVVNWMHKPGSDALVRGRGLVLVVSHRGNWEYCPENTLQSFQSAWDLGAEAIEMDIRLSAPGNDTYRDKDGKDYEVNYPEGEAFLSHDYDIRGEAPNPNRFGNNYIYSLTPAQLRVRNMADRHGLIVRDSSGNFLHLSSLTDLLYSMYYMG